MEAINVLREQNKKLAFKLNKIKEIAKRQDLCDECSGDDEGCQKLCGEDYPKECSTYMMKVILKIIEN